MPDFPDYCIRGIKKKSYIYEDTDTVSSALYMPDPRTKETRSDGGSETSINWEDNDNVLDFTLQSLDDNNQTALAFPHGAVKLSRNVFDNINNSATTLNTITYERQKLPKNHYHGNIVFRTGLPNHTVTMIANVFALFSSRVYRKRV